MLARPWPSFGRTKTNGTPSWEVAANLLPNQRLSIRACSYVLCSCIAFLRSLCPLALRSRAAIDPSRRFRHSRTLGLASVAADEGLVLNATPPSDPADSASTPMSAPAEPPQGSSSTSRKDALDEAAADLFSASPPPPPFTKPRKGVRGGARQPAAPQLSQANAQRERRVRPPPSQDGWWNS